MKNNWGIFVFIIVFIACSIGCVLPYPVFASKTFLSASEQKIINDTYEDEEVPTTSSPAIQVLNLNWFDTMNEYFTKYVKTRVIDVYTQKQYYIKRTGGHYHADVETIDSANTAIFKSLYDGEWSWARRPVWVEINGTFVAGSINGMPHGYSLIEGNNENGHSCIHFLQSKTHGTKRVDEAHQNCVQIAFSKQNELNNFLKKQQI